MIIHKESRAACEAILLAASPPTPPTYAHPSIAHLVPDTWDGLLPVPFGWSINWSIEGVQWADIDTPTQWELDHLTVLAAPELLALVAEYEVSP